MLLKKFNKICSKLLNIKEFILYKYGIIIILSIIDFSIITHLAVKWAYFRISQRDATIF